PQGDRDLACHPPAPSLSSAAVAAHQRQELLAGDAEASGRVGGERGGGHAGHEGERRVLVLVELDLQELEAELRLFGLEPLGEGEEMGADEDLGAELAQETQHYEEDLLALGGVGAGAELVED